MLEPQDRRLLLESLRPPAGYAFDAAIGTTYSLDLLALLTAPLAFTFFDWEDGEGQPVADPLALLEAVRRNVDRLAIFCQAGEIKVPTHDQRLFPYLESAVVPVAAPGGGVFHPKVWVLRFAGDEGPTLYRFLCLSRNLTFDQSWDTVLCLDGELIDRQKGVSASRPLADFVAALPGMAVGPVPERVASQVERMQDELRRVRFELPEGIDELTFWPLGLKGRPTWPFWERVDRALVVSPFLSDGCLERLTEDGKKHVLVTRPEAAVALKPPTLERFEAVRALRDTAQAEPTEAAEALVEADLEGLHAKLYVIDAGWDAGVWTGSANATDAAFATNVEFLVELRGKKSRLGVEAILATRNGEATFGALLQDVVMPTEPVAVDEVRVRLEKALGEAHKAIWQAEFTALVQPAGAAFDLSIKPRAPVSLPGGVTASCWPITLRAEASAPLGPMPPLFPQVSFEALTAFFAFEVTCSEGERRLSSRFVLNLPLEGAPADRRDRILRLLLRDRDQVMRLLMLLLADGDLDAKVLAAAGSGQDGQVGAYGYGRSELLESLLRALDRSPARLDQVASLVKDLRDAPEGRELLPERFEEIWEPIWSIRERLRDDPSHQA